MPFQLMACKLYVNTTCMYDPPPNVFLYMSNEIYVCQWLCNAFCSFQSRLILILRRDRLNTRTSLRTQMDADAINVSQCIPAILFKDQQGTNISNMSDVVRYNLYYTLIVCMAFLTIALSISRRLKHSQVGAGKSKR
jgi:hypothetical protein